MVNYARFAAALLVVAVFFFIADGFIHGQLLAAEHKAAIMEAGKPLEEDPSAFAYFAAFDLGKALVVMLIYIAVRAWLRPGAGAAIWSGIVAWFAVEMLPNIANMPFPFYRPETYWKWGALEIVPMIFGALLGGWIYRDARTAGGTIAS
jgi:hypothetical protein